MGPLSGLESLLWHCRLGRGEALPKVSFISYVLEDKKELASQWIKKGEGIPAAVCLRAIREQGLFVELRIVYCE